MKKQEVPAKSSEEAANVPTAAQPEWKLQYLDLSENSIGHQGALHIGRSLEVGMNKTLTTLVLDFNPLSSEGASSLCKGIATNSSLKGMYYSLPPSIRSHLLVPDSRESTLSKSSLLGIVISAVQREEVSLFLVPCCHSNGLH